MLKMHRLVTWEAISEPISLDSWQMKQLWPNKGEQSDCFLCCLFAVGQSVRLKMSQNGILGEENWVDISYCIYCEAILKGLAAQSKAKKYKIHWLNLGAIQHRVTLTYVYTDSRFSVPNSLALRGKNCKTVGCTVYGSQKKSKVYGS